MRPAAAKAVAPTAVQVAPWSVLRKTEPARLVAVVWVVTSQPALDLARLHTLEVAEMPATALYVAPASVDR